jgi:hypothetical protein
MAFAVDRADWLADTDRPAVALGRDLMLVLDHARKQATFDGMVVVNARDYAELSGRALQIIKELGFTPAQRHRMGLWDAAIDDAFGRIFELVPAAPGNETQ